MKVIFPKKNSISNDCGEIATIIATHVNNQKTHECINDVNRFVGDKFFCLIDGASSDQFDEFQHPIVKGFHHKLNRAPYRNLTLGLKKSVEKWAGSVEWLLYCEYDVQFMNDHYKSDLVNNGSIVGFDHRIENMNIPVIDKLFGKQIDRYQYLIGACVFHRMSYLERLYEMNFFDRFLNTTEFLPQITFPGYSGYDLGEHLYPTLAGHFGPVINLTNWIQWAQTWNGKKSQYSVRWRPEVEEREIHASVSIIHPRKSNAL